MFIAVHIFVIVRENQNEILEAAFWSLLNVTLLLNVLLQSMRILEMWRLGLYVLHKLVHTLLGCGIMGLVCLAYSPLLNSFSWV